MYDENTTAPNTSDYRLNPLLSYLGTKAGVKFKGSCLKQDKVTYDPLKSSTHFTVYEIGKNFNISSYSPLEIVYLVQLVQECWYW